MKEKRIGYVGPGRMGSGIVKNLLKNKIKVTIYAHRPELNLNEFTKMGALVTDSLSKLAAENDTIMLTLPSSKEVEQVILGENGLSDYLKSGSVVIDFSTSHPSSTRMIAARLSERKIEMLDAPMTGGPAQAEKGELNIMVGGSRKVYEEYLDIFRFIAKNIFYVGGSGSGHVVKLINNFLGQVNNAAISEILPLAVKSGVDLDTLYNVVLVSGGNSRLFEGGVPNIYKRNFAISFKLKFVQKDLKYICELGREQNVPLPIANSALEVFDIAMAYGLGEENFNSLVRMWEDIVKVTVKAQAKPVPNDGTMRT